MSKKFVSGLLLGLVCLFSYVGSYSMLNHYRSNINQDNHSKFGIWNLSPTVLLAVTGEFKGIVADYLTLEVGSQLGTKVIRTRGGGHKVVKRQYDWPAIHKLFLASQTLDPSFAQTYLVAQGWLPWEPANMVTQTQEILKTAADNRPWDWRPTHIMGFNTYFFLNNTGEAGKLFLEAARRENAPSFLSILGARLAQQGGETEIAVSIIKLMLSNKNDSDSSYDNLLDRLHALEGVLIIEQAVKRYENVMGRKPLPLTELTASNILASLPSNPYNLDYCINREGKIFFDKPDCFDIASETK